MNTTYKIRQKVLVYVEGEARPGVIENMFDQDFFILLADGTRTGCISSTRLSAATILRNEDRITVEGVRWKNHYVASLSGYGKEYGDYDGANGLEQYNKALLRNGKAVWIGAEATVISAHRERPVQRIIVRVGEAIWFDSPAPGESGWYRVAAPGRGDGDNSQLVRL